MLGMVLIFPVPILLKIVLELSLIAIFAFVQTLDTGGDGLTHRFLNGDICARVTC